MIYVKYTNGKFSSQQEISSRLFIPTGNMLVKVTCTPAYKSDVNHFEDEVCKFLNMESIDGVPIYTNHVTPNQSIEIRDDGTYIIEITFQVFINDMRL